MSETTYAQNDIEEIRKSCESLRSSINATFDRLFKILDGEEVEDIAAENAYPFTADTYIFIGKQPIAVLFGEEKVEADNWRKVFAAIMSKCNADAKCHNKLMDLRDRIMGRDRVLLSRSPESMRRPLKIDEGMYAESHYGTATLLYILRDRILTPAGYDFSASAY